MSKPVRRRAFLKLAGRVVIGSIVIYGSPAAVLSKLGQPSEPRAAGADAGPPGYNPKAHEWVFIVDTARCIGCGRCVRACKEENRVPMDPRYTRTWIERYVQTEDGEMHVDSPDGGIHGFTSYEANREYAGQDITKAFFVPKLCNQCEKPPCVQVCPVAATYQTEDGIVLVNRDKCIGCRYCIQACPYGARYLDPDEHVADKCTWCYHRISRGLPPACVVVCPVGARKFGDLRDPESEVSKIVAELRLYVLKEDLGTKPRVHYTQLDEGVR
jgi:Fe-S-cluster-containing dehydrogenase component